MQLSLLCAAGESTRHVKPSFSVVEAANGSPCSPCADSHAAERLIGPLADLEISNIGSCDAAPFCQVPCVEETTRQIQPGQPSGSLHQPVN